MSAQVVLVVIRAVLCAKVGIVIAAQRMATQGNSHFQCLLTLYGCDSRASVASNEQVAQ